MSERDSWWLVISLDMPYSGIEVDSGGTIRVPFATQDSARRAEGAIMTRVEGTAVVLGEVVPEPPALAAGRCAESGEVAP